MTSSSDQMHEKVCVVTGANSGIGRTTVLGLARMGATVVLVCRSRTRGEEARAAIRQSSGSDLLDLMLADLSSQAEIRRLGQELLARYPQIHVLVNNAGVLNVRRSTTVDGIETVFAVNHLAYFLLTHLLLERLRESGHGRIVNVASDAHQFGKLDFNDLQNQRHYRFMQVYGQSKLCNILFTRELAPRIAGTGVSANCLHPGTVATRLGQNNGWLAVLISKALTPVLCTVEQGARTSIYLAASPAVEGVSGKYFRDCQEAQPSPAAQDEEAAKRLWRMSAELTGLTA
ncbi:MAG: SDR family oxidoreductase [Candidatus Methylomirabilia bacterium]